ncbi:DUF2079 domain-containing protein [Roseiflexus castenholzii]|jgi:uncharacterized membrane protein|uniref:Membrane protein-like protein n=1 Tax=Roseiflexus castenholzii (strain DSM 13941 / HLO8) TaxID=383372 RepID=A7NHC7_ROSCS|nr:DUF2079 domain-containing protein [Roseiflexus castenholzii]ABU56874.1 membrane protein-like protein [Roseiflexus castenholzii DSM 13941]
MSAEPHPSLRDPFLWIALLLIGGMLGWLSVARYEGFNAGMYDLGNMAQSIWSATRGEPLLYSRPEGSRASRLAGHVEVGYFLFAPFYALWPDPRMLLVAQAALFALGAIPVYRLAWRRLDAPYSGERAMPYAARCLTLIYLLYPTAQTSVLFDFHADTVAAPLILLALDALDVRSWRRFALWTALALSMKFYVAALVVGIGVVVWLWEEQRRAGMLTTLAGGVYGALAFFVIRPLFATQSAGGAAEITGNYLAYYFGAIHEIAATLPDRLLNAVVVFGPALLVAWRGWRWLLPGLPLAGAMLISTGPGGAFDYRYHHYALVAPFLVMATIDGAARMQRTTPSLPGEPRHRGRSWRGDLGFTVAVTAIFSALLVNTPLNPLFWIGAPGYGFDRSVYGVTPRDARLAAFLTTRVPPDAPLAASTFVATHLVNRETVYLVRYPFEARPEHLPDLLPQVQYALPDALFDWYLQLDDGYGGGLDYDREAIAILLRDPSFALVDMEDGLLLFERDADSGHALVNRVSVVDDNGASVLQQFGPFDLVRANIEVIGERRLRASFAWRVRAALPPGVKFVAVSRLDGAPGARFVHLPGYALHPVWEWSAGDVIEETFDVLVPPDTPPGRYAWRVGWYDVRHPDATLTDERSRMAGTAEYVVTFIEVTP